MKGKPRKKKATAKTPKRPKSSVGKAKAPLKRYY